MHNNDDIIVLDFLESEFRFCGPEGIEILDGTTGLITQGRYCHVHQVNDSDVFKVVLNDIAINIDAEIAEKLSEHISASFSADIYNMDGFYCSSLNYADIGNAPRDEWWCYPADNHGCDVTFHDYECEDQDFDYSNFDPERETLVLTTHLGETSYLRKDAKVFSHNDKFFLGYIFQATEISKPLYEVLRSSNRASDVTTEETATFGKVESFFLHGAPTMEDMMTNTTVETNTESEINF